MYLVSSSSSTLLSLKLSKFVNLSNSNISKCRRHSQTSNPRLIAVVSQMRINIGVMLV